MVSRSRATPLIPKPYPRGYIYSCSSICSVALANLFMFDLFYSFMFLRSFLSLCSIRLGGIRWKSCLFTTAR